MLILMPVGLIFHRLNSLNAKVAIMTDFYMMATLAFNQLRINTWKIFLKEPSHKIQCTKSTQKTSNQHHLGFDVVFF